MADLKTTNIYGDAYINNKVGINTNTPATRLQIGQLSPTAATEGIQFGDDTAARLHRINTGHIRATGGISSATFIIADNYLQTNNNLIYPSSQTATQRLEVGNASGNAWIDGLTIAQGGNVTVYNNLTVNGNTYLGDANGDTVFVNDTIRIGATDSGDASLFFGEGGLAGSDYGARWYWDSGYTFTWYTRNAGTDTALFDYVTNNTSYLNWRRHFHMQNKEINYNSQIHFNAGTRFVGSNTNYLIFRSDATNAGGIIVQDGSVTTKGYTGYWDSTGGGILNNTGNWSLRYNFGNANSGGTLYGAWVVNGNISASNLSGTNTGDQTVGNGTITIAAGTGVGVGTTNTFTTNQSGATTVTISNSGVTSNVAGTGISVSGATGAVTITNSGVTSLAGTTNRITVSGATGGVTLNLPQDIHTGASPTFAGLSLTSVSTTGATITNLTGAYQNTTVYDSPRTQSATPSRGIRAPASSIQFTDSYAIAPFYTYRSTGDWPVPYGIGWGTGGESSGIFQRYASNGSSFGDMIFYTGNDGYGAFSFRRHTWEGTTYFAAGSGELNTELFRIDWSGNLTMLGTLNGSANSATLYANNGSYGSWKIGGTRNGWYGIEFESGTNLMANSNEVGFHRNGHGWQLRWSNGVGYVYKGAPGGGTEATILDSSNYTSYTPGLGTNNTLTGINVINNTSNTVINNQSGNLGLTMFQATAGTDAYMTFHIGSDYAAYLGLGGAENDLVYGGWSAGNNRHRILHSGNAAYAWNMNQYVRTTDSPTFNTVTANITGNAYNNLSNDYKDIYVYGDVNTYYVVLIQGEYLYSFGRYSVTRGYNWTGPDTWNIATHKGGLTLDWEWSGDTAWGGNDKAIRIIEFNETYSTMVAGLGYPVTGGVIIWLRGGGVNGAQYRIRTPNGSNSVVTVYDGLSIANHVASTTFTAGDSTVFSTRANTNNVSAEILARYPVRATGGLFDGNNAVLHAGNYNSYSPTLTGTGASGTWGISVTGNAGGSAASCTGNAATATTLQTARNINGTSFNGSAAITTATWGTARTLTIGSTGKSVDGSAAIAWSLAEIGAAATNQTMFVGTTSVAINRASSAITLTGTSIDGNAATATSATSATFLNSSNYIQRIGSSGNYNTDFQNTPAGSVRHQGDDHQMTNNPGGGWWFVDNYRHSNASNYWGTQVAWGWEDNANRLATRNVIGGTFGGWVYYLNSNNYTDYTVTKTGTGASGTWGINITGNAATATTATNVTIANGSVTLAKIENITAYTILGNSNASAAATPAALSVATVATMLSGQTMNINGSSTSCSGTATNATTAGGLAVHTGTNDEANKIVRTQGNGYIMAGWINTISGDNGTTAIDRVYASSDGYIRYYTPANFRTVLDVPTRAGSGASGNWAINITGNAATATLATKASTLSQGGGNGTGMTFNWSGQGGQPTWLWGSNDGTNIYVWNPSNFNVNYATSAGSATSATTAGALTTGNTYTIAGLTSNGTINIFPPYASSYSYFLRMGYDNSGNYDYTVKRNGTTGFLEFNGTQTNYVAYYFAVSGASGIGIGVSPAARLHINGDGTNPPIRIDNPALGAGASNSRGFYGWLPISIGGVGTKYIQLYN